MNAVPVLLVDDDVDILHIGKVFLEEDGSLAVETATSAEDALKRITVQPFDVIVCDYKMPPGMDSIGLLHAMKAQGITIPLIVFAWSSREYPENTMSGMVMPCAFMACNNPILSIPGGIL